MASAPAQARGAGYRTIRLGFPFQRKQPARPFSDSDQGLSISAVALGIRLIVSLS